MKLKKKKNESVSQLFFKKEEFYNWPHQANVDGEAK